MIATGVHVFAGGFTQGVLHEFDVIAQMEIHSLGLETVTAMGVDFMRRLTWKDWPRVKTQFVFGNPRCSGFSSMTPMQSSRGPWSKQTQDIHDLCTYGVAVGADVVVWESVQGAYTVGRELLNYLTYEMFKGYRVAHVFVEGKYFNNSQKRKRYFFVAYRGGNFNVFAPSYKLVTVKDVIISLVGEEVNETALGIKDSKYDANSHTLVRDELKACIPHIRQGCGMNEFAHRDDGVLEKVAPRLYEKWLFRSSEIPFGIQGLSRMTWNKCPTLHGGCDQFIHPAWNRTITVGEVSALMGWDNIPTGDYPMQQLAKGIIPNAGRWIAQQVKDCIGGKWGDQDFGIGRDGQTNDTTGKVEKVIYV